MSPHPGVTLTPVAVIPEQRGTANVSSQPEKRLLLAVLEDALSTALRDAPTPLHWSGDPRKRARAWISSDDVGWPFSFVNVCEFLGFDPAYLRRSMVLSDPPRRRIRCGTRHVSGSRNRVTASRNRAAADA